MATQNLLQAFSHNFPYLSFTIENGQKIGHLSQFQKLEGVQKAQGQFWITEYLWYVVELAST